MSFLRGCLEICFSPNTISKFVRIFPKAALLFLILHVGIMLMTALGYWRKNPVQATVSAVLPQEPRDDLGVIPVHKPDNWEIPRRMPHHNSSELNKNRKKRKEKERSGEQTPAPLKLIED